MPRATMPGFVPCRDPGRRAPIGSRIIRRREWLSPGRPTRPCRLPGGRPWVGIIQAGEATGRSRRVVVRCAWSRAILWARETDEELRSMRLPRLIGGACILALFGPGHGIEAGAGPGSDWRPVIGPAGMPAVIAGQFRPVGAQHRAGLLRLPLRPDAGGMPFGQTAPVPRAYPSASAAYPAARSWSPPDSRPYPRRYFMPPAAAPWLQGPYGRLGYLAPPLARPALPPVRSSWNRPGGARFRPVAAAPGRYVQDPRWRPLSAYRTALLRPQLPSGARWGAANRQAVMPASAPRWTSVPPVRPRFDAPRMQFTWVGRGRAEAAVRIGQFRPASDLALPGQPVFRPVAELPSHPVRFWQDPRFRPAHAGSPHPPGFVQSGSAARRASLPGWLTTQSGLASWLACSYCTGS